MPHIAGKRSLMPKAWLAHLRAHWADYVNERLPEGVDRISHLSLAEQGVERLPQLHLGHYSHQVLMDKMAGQETADTEKFNPRLQRAGAIAVLNQNLKPLATDEEHAGTEKALEILTAGPTEPPITRGNNLVAHYEVLRDLFLTKFALIREHVQLRAEARADRLAAPQEREPKPKYPPPSDDGGGGWGHY